MMRKIFAVGVVLTLSLVFVACGSGKEEAKATTEKKAEVTTQKKIEVKTSTEATTEEIEASTQERVELEDETISWDDSWEYAEFSKIHSDDVILYRSKADQRKNITIAVNAGHGTSGGEDVKTPCHPDGSEKVTSGTTSKGATSAMAVSSGMDFTDGYPEAKANLSLAEIVKKKLLKHGYDVLMIRENNDTQLDNIARTVYANNNADYHIALHYDGTESDKGCFFMTVPDVESYKEMEPVASHWKDHDAFGRAVIEGLKEADNKIYDNGEMEMDLTQTSFSTIPSIDLEVGDAASDYSKDSQKKLAKGIVLGIMKITGEKEN